MENLKNHSDIRIETTKLQRNYMVSEPNNHTKNPFLENLLAIEMKKYKYS